MNALQPLYPPPPKQVRRPRRRPQRQQAPHQATALEAGLRLGFHSLLAIAAVAALVKLIPYNLETQEKLKLLMAEVETLDRRVQQLENDFGHDFDPQQAQSVMQEQSNRIAPGQIRVVWTENPDRTQVSER